jgi:hypothetical protein
MLTIILQDAGLLFNNDSQALQAKYGIDGRQVIYSWFQAMAAMEKDMTKSGQFEQAKFVKNSMSRAIEPAFNFYGIKATPVKEEIFLLIFSLAFYVVYTMWYGFGLLYLFEGYGIKLDH